MSGSSAVYKILSRPPILELETVNTCNAKCLFCPSPKYIRQHRVMSEDLFERVVEQLSNTGCEQLALIPMLGDPLMDPLLVERVHRLASLTSIDYIRTNTNLIFLDRFNDDEINILLSSIKQFIVSIAPNREDYHKLFGVDCFEKIIESLQRIARIRNNMEAINQLVFAGRSLFLEPYVDDRLSSLAEELSESRNIRWTTNYKNWGGEIVKLPGDAVVNNNNFKDYPATPCLYSLCPHIWTDGRVSLCACSGFSEELVIGDLTENSLKEILHSSIRVELISSFLNHAAPELCSECSFYTPFKKIDWNLNVNQKIHIDAKTSYDYYRNQEEKAMNRKFLEHLDSLNLNYRDKSIVILEAGPGDFVKFFSDRLVKSIKLVENKKENLQILHKRFDHIQEPAINIIRMDLNLPGNLEGSPFEIVFSYNMLHKMQNPGRALKYLNDICANVLILATCVTDGVTRDDTEINDKEESNLHETSTLPKIGNKLERGWIFAELGKYFDYVYLPHSQPDHKEFPLNWVSKNINHGDLNRAVFIASRNKLNSSLLTDKLPIYQAKYQAKTPLKMFDICGSLGVWRRRE